MWFKKVVLCWLLGHQAVVEEAIGGLIRCTRCNAFMGQLHQPPAPPSDPKAGD
jgi:hypothetical protein